LRNVLPEKIVKRKTKGDPSEVILRALAREYPRLHMLFADARVCAYGYMDSRPLLAALDRAKHGCEPNIAALFKTIALELWLRDLERQRLFTDKSAAVTRASVVPLTAGRTGAVPAATS
jgi:hypothetical protein